LIHPTSRAANSNQTHGFVLTRWQTFGETLDVSRRIEAMNGIEENEVFVVCHLIRGDRFQGQNSHSVGVQLASQHSCQM